jgi:hypothetical protein
MTYPITLRAGDRDLTKYLPGASLSNVDPGGYEVATIQPDALSGLRPGDRVTCRFGFDIAWDGYVNEPGQSDRNGRSDASLGCVGYGALYKSPDFRGIFVDRVLGRWASSSVQRQVNVTGLGYAAAPTSVIPDATTGQPSLDCVFTGPWAATALPVSEAWYDAQGLDLASIYYAWKRLGNTNIAGMKWQVLVCSDDVATAFDSSGDLRAAGPGSGTIAASVAGRKFGQVQFFYDAGAGGGASEQFHTLWTCLAVYGTHGLTKRGVATATEPQGFYPGDIAGYANNLGFAFVADDSSSVIVRQSAYLAPVSREQVIQDMATLMGWHWGVWEPANAFETIPRLLFQAPPSAATCVVRRSECEDLQEPTIRFDKLIASAVVGYRDQAGTQRYVTVTSPNPLAQQVLGSDGFGSVAVDLGTGSLAAAQAYGAIVLQLLQSSARGSGSAILPDTVALPDGGRKPACLLKAGRDRIRIADLPNAGSPLAADTRRFDTFLVRRVTTTFDANGAPKTRVEFDTGADLLETLAARQAVAASGLISG